VRLKLISCEIFYREMCLAVARSPNFVDVEFLPKGLHDIGSAGMLAQLQAALDRVDASRYETVLLGYGLCNNGLVGLQARTLPIVIPRAHDCITLFLGNKEKYLQYFHDHPGVYFLTTGWLERNTTGELRQASVQHKAGMDWSYEELVAKYGEDNARYLYEQLAAKPTHYRQMTFIEMGLEPNASFEQRSRDEAARRGWSFEKVAGDFSLIQRLVDGPWNEGEFLVVPPGRRVTTSFEDSIIKLEEPGDR
jgi:hypothetical protein